MLQPLTHFSRKEFLTVINWTSSFPFEGLLGGIFHFYSNFNRTLCKQTLENDQTPSSDLGLHCLPMSHKKETRLKWVNPYKPTVHANSAGPDQTPPSVSSDQVLYFLLTEYAFKI